MHEGIDNPDRSYATHEQDPQRPKEGVCRHDDERGRDDARKSLAGQYSAAMMLISYLKCLNDVATKGEAY